MYRVTSQNRCPARWAKKLISDGLPPLMETFARHQWASYQTYRDVSHTNRKPMIKSTILDGQTRDLSNPGSSYKQKVFFTKSRDFKFWWKIDLSLLPYTVFDAEFDSGSKIGPKWIQDPILTNFRKIRFFARRRGGLTQFMTDAHMYRYWKLRARYRARSLHPHTFFS